MCCVDGNDSDLTSTATVSSALPYYSHVGNQRLIACYLHGNSTVWFAKLTVIQRSLDHHGSSDYRASNSSPSLLREKILAYLIWIVLADDSVIFGSQCDPLASRQLTAYTGPRSFSNKMN